MKKERKEQQIYTMDDNIKYHITKVAMEWKAKKKIPCLPWPIQSLNFTLIENFWAILKRKISAKRHRIHNAEKMQRVAQEEWAWLTRK